MTAEASEIIIPYCPRPEQAEIHAALEAHRFCVLVAHRRMGKTVCVVNHLIKQAALCTRQNGQFAYVAPQRNQAKDIAWLYLKRFTEPIPGRVVNETELSIMLPNRARIRIYGADNPDSLRGIYIDGVCMDEVAQMKPEVWGEIVRPALSDRQGFAVFIGTPKGMNLFHELYQRSLTTPGWFGGTWRADQTGSIPPEELAAVRDELSAEQYRQEFLCDFSASSDDILIPIDLADAAARRQLTGRDIAGAEKIIGVDVSRFGGDRSVICRRQGLFCHPMLTYSGLDTQALVARVIDAMRGFGPDATCIDIGYNPGVYDGVKSAGYSAFEINFGGKPLKENRYYNKRAEMWGEMRDWMRRGGSIPDDPDLKTDLSQPRYGYADDGARIKLESKERIKARGGRSPDLGDALALTFAVKVAGAGRTGPFSTAGAGKEYNAFGWMPRR
jgi:hypothetical protein